MKIYTKTGDDGTTGLIGGSRVKKYDVKLEAYGTVDELNSHIGLILATEIDDRTKQFLLQVQSKLFIIGAQLATDVNTSSFKEQIPCREEDILVMEQEIDYLLEELPQLQNFLLPSGSIGTAYAHVARTVCRRAERRIVELAEKEEVNENLIKYVNRLSDYLFALARKITHDLKLPENLWFPPKNEV